MSTVVPITRWTPSITFGARVRATRLEYGERVGERMTQDRFAQIVGVGAGALAAWEKGTNLPEDPERTAYQIADAINCDPLFLLGLTEGTGGPGGQNTPVITDGSSFACTNSGSPVGLATVIQLTPAA